MKPEFKALSIKAGEIKKGRITMIKTVIRIKNNMVIVFDADGEPVPQYQGQYEDVKEIILRDAPAGTVFNHWFGYTPKFEAVPIMAS